jgi:hypothetical protein
MSVDENDLNYNQDLLDLTTDYFGIFNSGISTYWQATRNLKGYQFRDKSLTYHNLELTKVLASYRTYLYAHLLSVISINELMGFTH